jgi:hypothetical protein
MPCVREDDVPRAGFRRLSDESDGPRRANSGHPDATEAARHASREQAASPPGEGLVAKRLRLLRHKNLVDSGVATAFDNRSLKQRGRRDPGWRSCRGGPRLRRCREM